MRGSCLCGGVAFEIEGQLTPIQLCHARRCQKITGSAFAPEMAARRSDFRWIQGEDLLTVYEAPLLDQPPPLRRSFCRVCGSPMPWDVEGTDFIGLLAGILDGDPQTKPFRHIFVGQKACWHEIGDALPRFEKRPPRNQTIRAKPTSP